MKEVLFLIPSIHLLHPDPGTLNEDETLEASLKALDA